MRRAIILLVTGAAISGMAAVTVSARSKPRAAASATALTRQAMECGRMEQGTLVAGCFLAREPGGALLGGPGGAGGAEATGT